jgi:hypothetical protein
MESMRDIVMIQSKYSALINSTDKSDCILFLFLDSYIAATAGLRTSRLTSGITVDSIDTAIEQFQEELDLSNEVSDQISMAVGGGNIDDDSDVLLTELEDIMKSESNLVLKGQTAVDAKNKLATTNLDILLPDIEKLSLNSLGRFENTVQQENLNENQMERKIALT